MAAFATEDRVQLQRLGASLAIALALHGAIAIALLNWGRAIFAPDPAAPLVINIDLAPLVGAPTAPQGASEPTPAGGGAAPAASERVITNAPNAAPAAVEDARGAGGAANRRDSLEPAATAPVPPAPAAAAPPSGAAGESAADSRSTAGGGGTSRAAPEGSRGGAGAAEPTVPPAGNLMNTPLDTSITVMPDLYSKKGGGGFGQKKRQGVFFRPLRLPGVAARPARPGQQGQPEQPGHVAQPERPHVVSPGGKMTTNAVGAHVQDRARAALAREAARAGGRNAIGGVASPGIGGGAAAANAPDAVTKNAIGMTVPVHPNVPAPSTPNEPKAGSVVATGNTASHAAIGGHDMIRPGAAGVLGGPARSRPGVLSGNDFHLRHP